VANIRPHPASVELKTAVNRRLISAQNWDHISAPLRRAKTVKTRQNSPLDTPLPAWQHGASMSASENQFFLTRAASMKGQRGKK